MNCAVGRKCASNATWTPNKEVPNNVTWISASIVRNSGAVALWFTTEKIAVEYGLWEWYMLLFIPKSS